AFPIRLLLAGRICRNWCRRFRSRLRRRCFDPRCLDARLLRQSSFPSFLVPQQPVTLVTHVINGCASYLLRLIEFHIYRTRWVFSRFFRVESSDNRTGTELLAVEQYITFFHPGFTISQQGY